MGSFLYYLIIFVSFAIVFSLTMFLNKKCQNKIGLIIKIISLFIGLFFMLRYMWGSDAIAGMVALGNTPITGKFANFVAIMLVWFTYSSSLLLSLYAFFDIKQLKSLVKWFALPISILNVCLLGLNFTAILGAGSINVFSLRGLFFTLEIGFSLGLSLFVFITSINWKRSHKTKGNKDQVLEERKKRAVVKKMGFWINVWESVKKTCRNFCAFIRKHHTIIFTTIVIILSTMPAYLIHGLFGFSKIAYSAKEFELPHRLLIYGSIILPLIIYLIFKNQSFAVKKFNLLFMCLGTLVSFSLERKFGIFTDPTQWPLHLCNTAMYIMPIVLIFKMKRFFYFTYFINVVGAFFAMIMPNYDATVNIYSTQLVTFYINHYIAFFMPMLFVGLGMFEKPKFAQFIYSMIGFFAYFVVVLILNAVFTGLYEIGAVSSTTDFFFINSDFIADKLGTWCENLRNNIAIIDVNGVKLTFYPLYQTLFFICYVGIGLVVWFVYEQGFEITKSLRDISKRKQVIKLEQLALESKLNGRSLKNPMNPENGHKLILDKFTKKYGSSSVYAVKDADLEVVGGEIFGFLGPNGAGKSTIIKSIVGIQPITDGRIEVCGYDVDAQSVEAKRQIGFVPDHYALYEKLTGREYINYIADLYNVSEKDRNERINGYVKRFKLETAFDNQMKTYSHGMKQKIAIMAALVHNPKIWILDEPLTGLDPDSIFQVKECMKEHKEKGNIVFFSSHIIDVVEKICDRIAIIRKGEILVTKTVKEIEESGVSLEDFYMNTISGEKNPVRKENSSEKKKETQKKETKKTSKNTKSKTTEKPKEIKKKTIKSTKGKE